MASLPVIEPVVKFHLSLNVSDLGRSIDFYRMLFGVEPAKRHDDYAKFELEEPPAVFSLVPRAPGPGASLSHLGFRVSDKDAIRVVQERLSAAGICTQEQCGAVCGYARHDKLWVKDPDDNFWEVYVVEEDVEPALVRCSLDGPAAPVQEAPSAQVWEHFLTSPVREPLPQADDSLAEVRLTGTFNAPPEETDYTFVVREAFRVLRPGGKVVTHGLLADRPLPGSPPKLPGLAAMVARVPARAEVVAVLRAAGFVGVQAVKLTEAPWFTHEGVGLREVKFIAWKPSRCPDGPARRVLYKGPFREATADGGWTFPRGQWLTVPASVWQDLQRGPAAAQFVFVTGEE
jgi:catechol 2,3-dioxygenase-like lactoylglutathione lyase family enzyme